MEATAATIEVVLINGSNGDPTDGVLTVNGVDLEIGTTNWLTEISGAWTSTGWLTGVATTTGSTTSNPIFSVVNNLYTSDGSSGEERWNGTAMVQFTAGTDPTSSTYAGTVLRSAMIQGTRLGEA
jgi:hypothetical protein